MNKAKIIGTGSYLPKKVLTNHDFEKMVETSDEWIVTRTGIKERRIAAPDEFTSDLAYQASLKAIEDAKISSDDIDLVIVATLTPDYIFPSTSCLLQNKLGAKNAGAFDIQAACSGFIYGLALAKDLVEKKSYKNVLLVAAEKLSSIVNYKDRATCVLFGDGAAACVISLKGDGFEIQAVTLGADGEQAELLKQPAGGSRNPASLETVEKNLHSIFMDGKTLFKHAVRRMEMACKEVLDKINMTEKDIAWLIPHQANDRIIIAVAKRFNHLPEERIYRSVVEKYGNTSASSVGIALDELVKAKKINNRENILFTVFGAGLTWGAAVITKNYE